MATELAALRHPKEKIYGPLVLVFGVLLWVLFAVLVAAAAVMDPNAGQTWIFVAYIVGFIVFYWLFALFYRTWLFGHAVMISERQLPHLHASLEAGAKKLGLAGVPQSFLYNSHGLMNAFAMRAAGKRMVLLTSALVDVESEPQVDFVIGHELGHHAAGHLSPWLNFLKWPARFIPFLGPAYHRARELTADRMGAYCVGDLEASRSALHMLACGSARLNAGMNADAFGAQEEHVPAVTGFLLHIVSSYPRLTRRVTEVEAYFQARGAGGGPGRADDPY